MRRPVHGVGRSDAEGDADFGTFAEYPAVRVEADVVIAKLQNVSLQGGEDEPHQPDLVAESLAEVNPFGAGAAAQPALLHDQPVHALGQPHLVVVDVDPREKTGRQLATRKDWLEWVKRSGHVTEPL